MKITTVLACVLAFVLGLSVARLFGVRPVWGQDRRQAVDMAGNLILASDGNVYQCVEWSQGGSKWQFMAHVPAESRPVAIGRPVLGTNVIFEVLCANGEILQYDGVNKRVVQSPNVFGLAPEKQPQPKVIGEQPGSKP